MKLSKLLDHSGTVGGIGHAKPAGISVKHLDSGFAVVNKSVDTERDEKLSLGCVDIFVKEFLELTLAVIEVVGSETQRFIDTGSWGRGSALHRFRR